MSSKQLDPDQMLYSAKSELGLQFAQAGVSQYLRLFW